MCQLLGCVLSPLLFNFYLDEFPRLLESSSDTADSITLPNGLPVNCLFYADHLIIISKSAAGLQKLLNILHNYSEKWPLKINLTKANTSIFQKQNRKSTRDKFCFLMELQLIRPHSTVILALLSTKMEVLLTLKKFWLKKKNPEVSKSKTILKALPVIVW